MLDKLEYLLALARERNFGKAAESCGVTQPSFSALWYWRKVGITVSATVSVDGTDTPHAAYPSHSCGRARPHFCRIGR